MCVIMRVIMFLYITEENGSSLDFFFFFFFSFPFWDEVFILGRAKRNDKRSELELVSPFVEEMCLIYGHLRMAALKW